MRRTGKLYTLTILSALSATASTLLLCLWGENTAKYHLWLDIVPQGLRHGQPDHEHSDCASCFSPCPVRAIDVSIQAMIASVTREDLAVATGSACVSVLCNTNV